LFQQYPDSVKADDLLKLAFEHSAPVEVLDFFIKQYPDSVKQLDGFLRLPLHYACGSYDNEPLEVVEFLVQQYPDSVTKTDRSGLLPLHIACDNSVSLEVLEFLV